jgi:hypothetical protein
VVTSKLLAELWSNVVLLAEVNAGGR